MQLILHDCHRDKGPRNILLQHPKALMNFNAPPTVRIVHSGLACNIEEERYSERVYTIREGETLELTCLVTGHPRPQIRWTKTAGSASDRFQDSSVFNETLRITNIQRHQGGRYYCKAENGLGSPAIKSIRVDVYYLDDPVVTVHQSIGEAKEQFYYERTVFLRCVANSNPPVRYSWRRGQEVLLQGSDKGVEIYEPFFTQVPYFLHFQGETKILKLKNLRPQDYANYSCIASVRSVCNIPDKMVSFKLSNKTENLLLNYGFPILCSEIDLLQSSISPVSTHQEHNTIRLQSHLQKASPSIKLLVDDPIVVNPGEAITLVCVTTGGEPTPTLTWVRFIGTLPEKTVLNGGTLTIPAITSDDAGTYSCIANNNVGNPAKKSTSIIVRALKKGRFWITPDPYHKDDTIQIGREVKISCQVEAIPSEELIFSWFKNGRPLRSSERMVITQTDPDVSPGTTNLDIIDLKFTDFGTYTCVASLKGGGISDISIDVNISSSTGSPLVVQAYARDPCPRLGHCLYLRRRSGSVFKHNLLTNIMKPSEYLRLGKAYAPEFYYDTYNPVWQNRHRVYSYSLQWTQMNPNAVDRIVAYRLGIRQAGQQRWWEQEIKISGNIQKGELITYNLTELIKPEAYEVRLTPLTKFGEGDSTIRIIKYSAPVNPHLREFHCGFEDGNICLFTQDDTDNFDWTKQSTATRNTKYTPNTGPNADRTGSKEGYYMYIETSRPRLEGEKARLLSPVFSIAPKNPYGATNTAYCFSFFYHMYGQHIGVLNVYLRLKGQTTIENPLWSSSGNKGQHWNEAHVNIYPITSFQLIFEGIRGPGIEGDIAIDDVSIAEGECAKQDLATKNSVDGAVGILVHIWLFPAVVLISILNPRR
ncbi:MAM domain-containing glycosylphosphatidylinositol anchor protein 2-like [Gracilinanus agilis]|uniref:MAM domain-containing glycosylphosphatidylinositol anchor protein 2-like n=1 Tax=Gracilinanus agilis TaxID=191870 RepID=UPI001CFEDB40|nr:MAM domain-containing glycosylphosphatidylinositol anchor protein 2-like [Gracilinanus agilis]